ncbi:uncharacterized protein N7469_011653 [Penicillium citrinum]|uniref:ATP-grasp domain-containing protein n=2 Tax=Penicillium TaxID=5073 RepID=A0A9W9TA36_PENCI|nr:uncharacterized protein N7469_011653 [Penicillium citrinum]KAJ5215162.1 hypothetical protein N7469_011653 [Penicillium citrinum]KAJ5591416.1 hypothetical protein N7450_005388 [Penicillium hetheringtonii]
MARPAPIVIAFFYESISLYLSKGYSLEECMELDKDTTIDAIIQSMRSNGYDVVPVGDIDELVRRIGLGEHKNWDLGFSISEGMHGTGREAQIPGILEAYQIPTVFSDAATLALGLDKAKTKMVLEYFGIPTAPFAVVPASCSDDTTRPVISHILQRSRHERELREFPLFIKPSCEGSSKGIYSFCKVNSPSELTDGVQKLQTKFPRQSILIERYLGGHEYSVSLLGTGASTRVIGTLHLDWDAARKRKCQSDLAEISDDIFARGFLDVENKNTENDKDVMKFLMSAESPEAQASEQLALQVWRVMELRDAGRVDIRWGADGKPYVLEVNPLPGLAPGYSFLTETARLQGISHEKLIGEIISSAIERNPHLKSLKIRDK